MQAEDEIFYASWLLCHDKQFLEAHRRLNIRAFPRGPIQYLVGLAVRLGKPLTQVVVETMAGSDSTNLRRHGAEAEAVEDVFLDLTEAYYIDADSLETMRELCGRWLERRSLVVGMEQAQVAIDQGDIDKARQLLGSAQHNPEEREEPLVVQAGNLGVGTEVLAAGAWNRHDAVPSGIDVLDRAWSGGIRASELGLIIGPTGTGKSMTACMIASSAFWANRYILYYCVTPETPILKSDFTWVAAGELQAGDEILGYDEEPTCGSGRKYRLAKITAAARQMLPCYRIHLSDGTSLTSTLGHRWLVYGPRNELCWRRTDALRIGETLPRLIEPEDADMTYAGGFVAAAFDGEGSLSGRGRRLSFAQKDNAFGKRVVSILEQAGFDVYQSRLFPSGVRNYTIRGGVHSTFRFLQRYLPERIRKVFLEKLGDTPMRVSGTTPVWVETIEDVGLQEVAALSSSTETYIAAGFGAHNTTELTREQIMGRILLGLVEMGKADVVGKSFPELLAKAAKRNRRSIGENAGLDVRNGDTSIRGVLEDLAVFKRERGFYPGLLILDDPADMAPPGKFDKSYEGYRATFTFLRMQIAKALKIPVWVSGQATRDQVDKARASLKRVGDAYAKAQKAHYVLGLAQTPDDASDPEGPFMWVYVLKDSLHGSTGGVLETRTLFGNGENGWPGLEVVGSKGFQISLRQRESDE